MAPVTAVVTTTRWAVLGARGTVGSSAMPESVAAIANSAASSSRTRPVTAVVAGSDVTWKTRTLPSAPPVRDP